MTARPLNFALSLVLVALTMTGCDAVDSMRNGFEHSQAVSAQLEKSLGLKSFVGFHWNNGVLTSVTITFDEVPQDRSLPEITDLCREAVLKEFKQEPKKIIVSFSITP
jgi:hypothetical protein